MKRQRRTALALAMLFSLLCSCGKPANPIGQKDEVRQEDIQLAEKLLTDKDLEPTERDIFKVANDLQRLDGTFWREVIELDGQPIGTHDPSYSISYENGTEETLLSTEDGSGPTNVIVKSGDITDTWVYRSSGQIVFNGRSVRTHCRDTKADSSVQLCPIPADRLNQSPESHEDLMTDPDFQYAGRYKMVYSLPLLKKAGEVTLSSRINALAVSAAESLEDMGCQASGAEIAAAVGAALAENKDLAGRCLAETTDSPSYKLFRYASEDAVAYVLDTHVSAHMFGDHFVWGILEQNNT